MLYYSTNKQSPKVGFKEATIRGQAPDGGLYFPEVVPKLDKKWLAGFKALSKERLAFDIIRPYVAGSIPDEDLFSICKHTVGFDFPLVKIRDDIYSLELFHGPTLAFKDVGARFMSGCLGYFSKGRNQKITVLVATSGDTGSAVANGFLGVDGVEVIILYPSGKVSKIQELQLTTLGQNITALEVQGTFDDCQHMVKQAFADSGLAKQLFLTSANSINVARWLPQQFYYWFALQQWLFDEALVISVPSGNFGNICAGLLAHVSGMPAKHFVAACNRNDVFTRYLRSGNFKTGQAIATISNAMDVGDPSNFVRIMELFGGQYERIKKAVSSYSIGDKETRATMASVFKNTGYVLDPHGAVGYNCLGKYLDSHRGEKGIFLETAHPLKFADVVEGVIGQSLPVLESMKYLLGKQKQSILMKPGYSSLKEFLRSHHIN